MAEDGRITLGYDGKKVEAGFSSLESRAKRSASQVESTFSRVTGRISGHFRSLGTGIAQGIGQGLTGAALQIGNQAIKEFGGFDLSALITSAASANTVLDDLNDRAAQLGTSAESLQRLELFGAVNGRSPEEMVASLARLNRSLSEVGDNDSAREAFAALGIDVRELARLEPDRQLIRLAEAFQEAESRGQGLPQIYDLLGKSGGNLLQILRQPIDDLRKLAGTEVIPEVVVARASQIADDLTVAADAKNKAVLQARTEIQLSDEQRKSLEAEIVARKKSQQAARETAAAQLASAATAGDDEDTKAAREKEEKLAASRKQAAAELATELSALAERARGNDEAADAIERQARVAAEARRIAEETGLTEKEALKIAEQKTALEERVNASGGEADGGRKRIKGFSRRGAGLPAFGGLDEFKRLQEFEYVGGGQDRRKFGAFFQGSDQRFGPRSAQISALEAVGRERGVSDGGGKGDSASLIQVNEQILKELQKLSSF